MGGGGTHRVGVLLDGKPISASQAGVDVHGASVSPKEERLYTLVSLPNVQRHKGNAAQLQAGSKLYVFTFG